MTRAFWASLEAAAGRVPVRALRVVFWVWVVTSVAFLGAVVGVAVSLLVCQ